MGAAHRMVARVCGPTRETTRSSRETNKLPRPPIRPRFRSAHPRAPPRARHDGQAVTCDDFRAAMAEANGVNLDQFEVRNRSAVCGIVIVLLPAKLDALCFLKSKNAALLSLAPVGRGGTCRRARPRSSTGRPSTPPRPSSSSRSPRAPLRRPRTFPSTSPSPSESLTRRAARR